MANHTRPFFLLALCLSLSGLVGCASMPSIDPSAFLAKKSAGDTPAEEAEVASTPAASEERAAEADKEAAPSIKMQEGVFQTSHKGKQRGYLLKPGDQIVIALRGIPTPEKIEDIIDESGFITLTFLEPILAEGKTASELEKTIRDAYIQEKIYKRISVNVIVPGKSYFMRGEVKQPGRFPLTTGTTLVQAVAGAGGFTEYANPKRVYIIRGDAKMTVDIRELEQNPQIDIELESGDVIVVERSFL